MHDGHGRESARDRRRPRSATGRGAAGASMDDVSRTLLGRVAVLVAAVCMTVLGQVGTASAGTSIRPDNVPTTISGQENGELAPDLLIRVGPNCMAIRAAAPSLRLLLASANNAGVALGTEE